MPDINEIHKDRFIQIREKLKTLGSEECFFNKVELLFYEVIAISRTYGNNISENMLLASLKQLEDKQYRKTQSTFRKRSQREKEIERFITQFNFILK